MARISDWAKAFGIFIEPAIGNPGETVYRVKDIFTTRDGSWEPSDKPGSVPQWARDAYLKPANSPQVFDDAGADHHLFGAISIDGNLQPFGTIHYYTYTDNSNHTNQRAKMHGWANIPIYGHSDTPGPWAWYPKNHNKADVVKGGGLPGGQHISWFAVWQPVTLPIVTPPIDPPTTPEQPSDMAAVWAELRRLSANIDAIWKRLDEWSAGK